ncbi:MAG TPA: hypothetical protein VJ798_10665 [Rhizomicrobium sp.]|nr:hypothetical protein [Rhizomicrobium sp.]
MAKEDKDEINPWTRERSFWQKNGGDLAMLVTSVFFLGLTIFLVGFLLVKPGVPGLSNVFKDPPPPPRQAEKFHYSVPGEVEVNIAPGKPIILPPPAQPAPQQQNR